MRDLTVEIVAEGPRDIDLITALINKTVPGNHRFLTLQPEISETEGFGADCGFGSYGAGWKGVMKWCKLIPSDFGGINHFIKNISPSIE